MTHHVPPASAAVRVVADSQRSGQTVTKLSSVRLRQQCTMAVAGLLAAALIAACGGGGTSNKQTSTAKQAQTKGKPTLTIGLDQGPISLNPATNQNGVVNDMTELSYAPLTNVLPNGTLAPGLAASWHYVGTGNRVFLLSLRHDAGFSDGKPVTASTVVSWLRYFLAAKGPLVSLFPQVASISAPSPWTVEIKLAAPNPDMPLLLSDIYNWGSVAGPTGVAKPSALEKGTDGAGEYVLVPGQTVAGDHYTFAPNPYYYDKPAIKYSSVVVKIITTSVDGPVGARIRPA